MGWLWQENFSLLFVWPNISSNFFWIRTYFPLRPKCSIEIWLSKVETVICLPLQLMAGKFNSKQSNNFDTYKYNNLDTIADIYKFLNSQFLETKFIDVTNDTKSPKNETPKLPTMIRWPEQHTSRSNVRKSRISIRLFIYRGSSVWIQLSIRLPFFHISVWTPRRLLASVVCLSQQCWEHRWSSDAQKSFRGSRYQRR